jgi:hypothetical protein
LIATSEVLNALAETHRADAKKAEIMPLINIAGWAESTRWILLLEYDRIRLASAASAGSSKVKSDNARPKQ